MPRESKRPIEVEGIHTQWTPPDTSIDATAETGVMEAVEHQRLEPLHCRLL
ncbi:MAG: hypothetical protein JJE04_13960 [Acidobacteriia bacterium]|nr:hypothetical protein [Terriglobia bacterium]